MKFKFLLLAFLLFLGSTKAQLVIYSDDFIQAGSVFNYQFASTEWIANQEIINITGQNVEWNIEDWDLVFENTESYVDLSGLGSIVAVFFNNPDLYPYTLSTHALPFGAEMQELPIPLEITNGYNYFRNDETGYYNTGLSFEVAGFPLVTQNDIVERIYKFPMHYADTDTSTLSYLTNLPSFGAYGQHTTRYTFVDSEGVLVTPFGEFDVLRLRAERHITDTLFSEQFGVGQSIQRPLQFDYIWISPEFEAPLFEMSVVEDVVISARFLFSQNNTGLYSSNYSEVKIYPNPATEYFKIEGNFSSNGTVRLFDLSGRLILEQGLKKNSINIENINPGIYLVEISGDEENFFVMKLIITE